MRAKFNAHSYEWALLDNSLTKVFGDTKKCGLKSLVHFFCASSNNGQPNYFRIKNYQKNTIMKKMLLLALTLVCSITIFAETFDVIITTDAEKLDVKILEQSDTEVKYKAIDNLNGPTFILSTAKITSIIYANGQIKTYKHNNTNVYSNKPQETGEATENLLEQPIYRDGNTYTYNGISMRKAQYASFLKDKCPVAYDEYEKGRGISKAGWAFFGTGIALNVCASLFYGLGIGLDADELYITGMCFNVVGSSFELACIPTLIVGYVRMHNSANIFNQSCVKKGPSPYVSLNASPRGMGIALNF